jgi:mannose-6-phosphate isomerase-like protein (cupin superfamily)
MIATGMTRAARGPVGVYPDGGRSIWLMGMLATFKAVSAETGGPYVLYETTVPPPHIHRRETEAYYVLEGTFEFVHGERTMRASAGDFVHIPMGVVHGFTNAGHGPARFLGIVTPGGFHEQLLAALGEPAQAETLPPPPAAPPDMQRIVKIARTYDTEVLPPPER